MVDLKDLRENPEKYRRGAELKNVKVEIDQILRLDEQHRSAQKEFEKSRSEQNEASKQISKLKDASEKQAAITRVGELKAKVKAAEEQAKASEAALVPLLLQVPQPPDTDVPPGKDAADNVVLYRWGQPRKFEFKPRSHIELAEDLGLVDFPAGVRIAGSRSYFLKGAGAELHWAILRLATDMMVNENGFVPMIVPVLVREAAMRGTGFFPAGREQAYRVGEAEEAGDELRFLTGTAEVGLTAYEMPEKDEVRINEADLPLKYVSVSTCFRREAGTYGKDTAGLYRVHQFDKCEHVVICRNDVDESKKWHLQMLGYAEEILKRLNLPYRVIQCCTGDIGVKNASMMDIETWMPSRQTAADPDSAYGETHSASRLYEFQARRLNLRYRGADGKIRFCHTLNNTVVASPRILIPIIENYQNADGSVTIPEVLRKYLNGRERIERTQWLAGKGHEMADPAKKGTALLTGASGGIGLELARCFAAGGFDLVLVARGRDALEQAALDCRRQWGARVDVIAADLSRPDAPREIADALAERRLSVDALVNNAGFGTQGRFDQIDCEQDLGLIQVNVVALTALTKLFVPPMIRRRRGWILNVSSVAAFQAGPLMAVYAASKAYVQSLSEALAVELEEFGIKVTALSPGSTPTGFRKRSGSTQPYKKGPRVLPAADVARAGYEALMQGKLLVIPGLPNQLLAHATRLAPRRWTARVAKKFNEG